MSFISFIKLGIVIVHIILDAGTERAFALVEELFALLA
jgi:hypothetical protein